VVRALHASVVLERANEEASTDRQGNRHENKLQQAIAAIGEQVEASFNPIGSPESQNRGESERKNTGQLAGLKSFEHGNLRPVAESKLRSLCQ